MNAPSFYQNVYELVRMVPAGRVTSYGAIAVFLGKPGGARVVGYAMGASSNASPPIPAHRVLNSKGVLTAKKQFAQPDLMQTLLENEGVEIKNNKVVNLEKYFWDPSIELSKQ